MKVMECVVMTCPSVEILIREGGRQSIASGPCPR